MCIHNQCFEHKEIFKFTAEKKNIYILQGQVVTIGNSSCNLMFPVLLRCLGFLASIIQ